MTDQSNKRGTGWECLHVAIDDASRLAFTAMMPDETKASAVAFLDAAIAWFRAHGVTVQRVMTDNGSAYSDDLRARVIDMAGAGASARASAARFGVWVPTATPSPENFISRFPPLLHYSLSQPVSPGQGAALRRRFGRGLRVDLDGSMPQPPPNSGWRERRVSEP